MTTSWATAARSVDGLPHDPCPGDVGGVRGLAGDLRVRAERLRGAERVCRGWDPTGWSGRAADAALAEVLGLAEALAGLARSVDGAAAVLERWAGELTGMQEEAAALGARAADVERRHALAGVRAVTSPEPAATAAGVEQERLVREHRELLADADRLHHRWVAASRRHAGLLDEEAPTPAGLPGRWWADGRDAVHDAWRLGVRRDARLTAWAADGAGAAATVAGLAALILPVSAPVTAPLALALGLTSTASLGRLAAGADGSAPAVAVSALGAGLGLGAGALGRVAAGGSVRRARLGRVVDGTGTAVPLALDLQALVGLRGDGEAAGTVTGVGGGAVAVTVHDVAEPWHVGRGWTGTGFADVATVPVVIPDRPTPGPAPRPVVRPGPRPVAPVRPGATQPPAARPAPGAAPVPRPTPGPAPVPRPAPGPAPSPLPPSAAGP